jgi:ABC-type lipoprotein release transport system permease subunit
MIPSLSWKNIWRNKVRSLIVMGAMAFGIFGGLFSTAIYTGMSDRRMKEALTKESSHIQIHDRHFMENPEVGLTLADPQGLVAFAESLPGVKAAASRLKIVTMINSPAASTGVTVSGIDPEREKRVSELYTAVYDSITLAKRLKLTDSGVIGTYLRDSTGRWFGSVQRNPIVIGEKLARKLKVKVNSRVVLTFQAADGNLTGGSFRVCGIYRMDNKAFEEMNVFVQQADLAPLAALPTEVAHEVAVFMEIPDLTGKVITTIAERYPDLEVTGWKELLPDLAMLNDQIVLLSMIMIIIIMAALGFGIVNTMLMVVLERVKEFGMLIAVGMSRKRVFYMIILESVLLCLTGASAGMAVGALFIGIFSRKGIDLSAYAQQGLEAMGFSAVMYPSLSWDFYLMVGASVIITGLLASVYPAWKALKLNPADALRTE